MSILGWVAVLFLVGTFLFSWFLQRYKHKLKTNNEAKITDNTLTAPGLLTVQSDAGQNHIMVQLVSILFEASAAGHKYMKAQPLRSVYQLKVTLKGARPPIWRRLLIASTDNLEDAHIALQIAMGWTNSHLHEFVCGHDHYGVPDEDFPSNLHDEMDYRLDRVLIKEKDKMNYMYDFGDGWEHEVVLEKILPFDPGAVLPVCLKGRRACPPEDIGGIHGYRAFLETISDPSHPEHEDMLEWIGGDFDPEHFDLAETNDLLQEYFSEQEEGGEISKPDTAAFSKDLSTMLNADDSDYLDQFLLERIEDDADTDGKDEGVLDITELDGLFTAIVSGPVMIPPSQWLQAVWGDFEPVWESEKEFEVILTLMVRHMNGIAANIMEHSEDFEPIFLEREVRDKTYTIVDEWCEGYRRGVALAAEEWNKGGPEMAILLTPILAFTSETNWRGHDFSDSEVENIQKAIAPNVRDIHAFWLMRREKLAPINTPVHRREPRVGRNDPCPCGSGKKYKKCCLH